MGLATEVECLWSCAGRLIDGSRSNTLPILMEALIFLNHDRELWSKETLVAAYSKAWKSMSKKARGALELKTLVICF